MPDPAEGPDRPDRVLVGVAWPYANGHLHLGHVAGCYLPPDIFSRYHRMAGRDVLMVSGSDEHGTPITVRAEDEGVHPAEITDAYHEDFLDTFDQLGIDFVSPDRFADEPDRHLGLFTRTGTDNHRRVVHDVFATLEEGGYIYEDTQDALYCEAEDRYLPDRYVEGNCPHCGEPGARGDQCDACGKTLDAVELGDPKCRSCGATPVVRTATHLFFKLSAFEDRLKEWVASKEAIFRDNVYDFTMNWLEDGLKDRPITRDIAWGVPVPPAPGTDGVPPPQDADAGGSGPAGPGDAGPGGDDVPRTRPGYEGKRIYVWFEAVIGYLSATVEWADVRARGDGGDPPVTADAWKRYWQDPSCCVYNFLAKDNIPFHTIIWPAMLMGYWEGKGVQDGGNLPFDVPANEYLNMAGEKFSTSRGVGGTVPAFLEHYPADALRYYLTRIMPENRDADFRLEEFVRANNDELVSTLGNLFHRALTFTAKHHDRVPEPGEATALEDALLAQDVPQAVAACGASLEACAFKDALGHLMELARTGNRYFDKAAPWSVDDPDRLDTILHASLTLSRALAILMAPFMPGAAERAWAMLGQDGSVHDAAWRSAEDPIEPGAALGEVEPLFDKLEVPEAKAEASDGGGAGADGPEGATTTTEDGSTPEETKMVSFEEFQKIDLRVGMITDVQDHPDADKLYLVQVDLGDGGSRQLVAGLRPYMDADDLRGEQCIVVANMEPAELRGETSEGMLLAAEKDGEVVLVKPGEHIDEGAKVM